VNRTEKRVLIPLVNVNHTEMLQDWASRWALPAYPESVELEMGT